MADLSNTVTALFAKRGSSLIARDEFVAALQPLPKALEAGLDAALVWSIYNGDLAAARRVLAGLLTL